MTYKQIETLREIRLWVRDLIVPAVVTTSTLMAIPEVRYAVKAKATEIKWKIQSKFKK